MLERKLALLELQEQQALMGGIGQGGMGQGQPPPRTPVPGVP